MRSRAASLPLACCALIRCRPPPSLAAARFRSSSRTISCITSHSLIMGSPPKSRDPAAPRPPEALRSFGPLPNLTLPPASPHRQNSRSTPSFVSTTNAPSSSMPRQKTSHVAMPTASAPVRPSTDIAAASGHGAPHRPYRSPAIVPRCEAAHGSGPADNGRDTAQHLAEGNGRRPHIRWRRGQIVVDVQPDANHQLSRPTAAVPRPGSH